MPCFVASVAQLVGLGVVHDHVAQVVVHDHQLEQARRGPCSPCCCRLRSRAPAIEPSCRATSLGRQLQVVQDFAAAACTPRGTACRPCAHQPLGQDRLDRGGDQKRAARPCPCSRVIVLGASLVCSVLNTMWPVSEACTAISAVSRSRISPTRILSGSCRRMARRHVGERVADRGVDRHLDDAVDVVLDRVLGRDQLVFDVVQLVERRVERRRLARAGRAR